MKKDDKAKLLDLLVKSSTPTADEFKSLVMNLDTYDILVKVFILEGTPEVFGQSPMKYVIFKEQVAERFGIGSQDVRIIGSARLGFSPSPHNHKYGKPFSETSDVDVVIVSERLFHQGSRELFRHINTLGPQMHALRQYKDNKSAKAPVVSLDDWRVAKEAVRNYVYQNLNPALLPYDNSLKKEIFATISSTAGLFLALEPKVFVSKIRCRVFRDWRAAEDYYTNSLRELARFFEGEEELDVSDDDIEEPKPKSAGEAVPQKDAKG